MRNTKIFGGSSHPELTALICEKLGVHAAPVALKQFSNQELSVEIGISIRNEDVFVIQSGSTSTNDHVMELLIMISACKIASARRITAILPYFPYCKQSKKKKHRTAITAKLIANMLTVAGVDHIITMDLHVSQMQGFFSKPVDNLLAEPSIAKWIVLNVPGWETGVVVSKNAGGAKRVTSLADSLRLDFALIHKDRSHHRQNAPARPVDAPSLITRTQDEDDDDNSDAITMVDVGGNHPGPETVPTAVSVVADGDGEQSTITLVGDVKGRVAFLMDDIIDGCRSFLNAADHLMNKCGAKAVYLIATHGVLSGDSAREIGQCASVHKLVVTNTFPIPQAKRDACPKIVVIDISHTVAEAIRRTHNGESISYLFHTELSALDDKRYA